MHSDSFDGNHFECAFLLLPAFYFSFHFLILNDLIVSIQKKMLRSCDNLMAHFTVFTSYLKKNYLTTNVHFICNQKPIFLIARTLFSFNCYQNNLMAHFPSIHISIEKIKMRYNTRHINSLYHSEYAFL